MLSGGVDVGGPVLVAARAAAAVGVSSKHAGTDVVHRDESDTLWLDGVATKPS